MADTTSPAFFEQKYRSSPDPWSFSSNPYEQDRYRTILAKLGTRRFRLALEPGCSVGVLTLQLSQHADQVLAFDVAPSAIAAARERCSAVSNISFLVASLAQVTPPPHTDLLLFSEVGYYYTQPALLAHLQHYTSHLAPGATLLACHWLGTSADHLLHGDQVHQTIHSLPNLTHVDSHRTSDFRIDVWTKSGA